MMSPREGQTYILLYMFTRLFDDSLDLSKYICMQSDGLLFM